MASNLSVAITADESSVRSQLALAQADVRAFGAQVRSVASTIRSGGDATGDLGSKLETLTGHFAAAKAEVAEFNSKLGETATRGFAHLNEGIKAAVEPLTLLSSRMRETAELAGITFAADKIREYISAMGELGEKTVNMAAAVGTTPHEFSLLSNALRLAGGDADAAGRTLVQLGRNMQTALTQPSSEAAKAITSLGISHQQLVRMSSNLGYALDVLADKFAELDDNSIKSADYSALMGRGWLQLVGVLRQGSAGFEDLKAKAEDTGLVLTTQEADALDQTGEKLHQLAMTLEAEGVHGFMAIRGAIDSSIDGLISFIKWTDAAIAAVTKLPDAEAQAEHFRMVREGKASERQSSPANPGYWPGGRHNPNRNPGYAGSNAIGPTSLEMNIGGMAIPPTAASDQDYSAGSGKPSAAPWPETTRGGGRARGGSGASDRSAEEAITKEAELFAAGERLKLQEAKNNAAQIQQIYTQWLAEVAALYGKDSTQYLNLEREKVAAAQRSAEQQQRIAEEAERKQEELDKKATEAAKRSAEEQTRTWDQVTKKISDQFASAFTDVLDRTKSWAQAIDDLMRSLIKDTLQSTFKSLFSSLLGGDSSSSSGGGGAGSSLNLMSLLFGSGGVGSALFGKGGLSGMLGLGSNGLLGGLLGSSAGGSAGAGLLGGLFGGGSSGDQDFSGGTPGPGGSAGGSVASAAGGGLLSALFGGLFKGVGSMLGIGSLFGFEHGGIVPSAAGGWAVPQLGSGGVLAQLHSNEMVLPAPISQGLQGMIAGGGAGGGTTNHNYNMSISALDSKSVMNAGPQILAAINGAIRNGGALRSS